MKVSAFLIAGALVCAGTASAQSVTDAQIASIVVTANQVDIDAGKLAQTKATNAEVKAFAERMVTDHTGVNKSAVDLVTRLKVTPADNPTSKSLKAGGDKNLAQLNKLSGAAFDKAYIDHEVVYHQQVLDAMDKTLIPGAANAELKALLVKVRPAFVAHRDHAKKIQSTIKGGNPAAHQGVKVHTVTIEGMALQPKTLTVKAGDSVIWVNKDLFPHTATSTARRFDSGQIPASGSWRYVARATGAFEYTCTLHPTMTGTLEVE